jgi:ABC-type glycerol-3-phosphate transport system permease component
VTLGSTNISIFDQEVSVMSLPIICLMLTCLVSLIFAILSTRPKISEKPIDQKSGFNLLFFNHFLQVSRSQFLNYINGLKNDHEKLYEELGKDLYNLGGILKKKYSLLTYAYNSFLIGMIITLISFFITKF